MRGEARRLARSRRGNRMTFLSGSLVKTSVNRIRDSSEIQNGSADCLRYFCAGVIPIPFGFSRFVLTHPAIGLSSLPLR